MPTTQRIIYLPHRAPLVRAAVECNDPSCAPIRIPAVAGAIPDIVDAVADVLVVAGEAVLEDDVQGLGGSIAPWLVVGHAGVADGDHAAVAGGRVWLAPATTAEAALGVFVFLVVDAVEAVGAVVPVEGGDCPGGDGTALWGCYGGGC